MSSLGRAGSSGLKFGSDPKASWRLDRFDCQGSTAVMLAHAGVQIRREEDGVGSLAIAEEFH